MINDHEYERALLFFNRKTIVHASTPNYFTNGLIVEISKDHMVIMDRVDGGQKFIFFSELTKPLEPFKELDDGE